jgi:aryl-alcohol dehydrogenase-like predicted oxidoreductase
MLLVHPAVGLNDHPYFHMALQVHHMLLQTPDEDAALKAIKLAFDNGVNFFDVAPFYAAGNAEEVRAAHLTLFA